MTILVNAALTLPYLYRLLLPEARALQADYGRLADSLACRLGAAALADPAPPGPPLGLWRRDRGGAVDGRSGGDRAFCRGAAGDLPLVVQQLTGAYRMEAAAAAALILVTLSFALFWAFDAGGRRAAA